MPAAPLARTRRVHRAAVVALSAAAGLATLPVGAQNLVELYDAARGYDATYASARSLAESTEYKADQARAARRPTVALTGTGSTSYGETPWTGSQYTLLTQHAIGVQAQVSIYNAALSPTITQAERGIELARAQLGAAEQDLAVRVAQAYFDVLSATDALNTVRANKAAISEQLASAKRNFEVGTATITDTREAEARFDLARAQELAADNDLHNTRLALDQLVGRSGVAPARLALPVSVPRVEPEDVDEWVKRAEAFNPQLKQAQLALEVARLEVEKARAAGKPSVGMSGSYAITHGRLQGESTAGGRYGPTLGGGNSAAVAVSVNVPLYNGGLVDARVREATALEIKARSDLEAARRTVSTGTRTAFFGVRSLTARVAALEAAEASSRLALEATQLGYKVGVRVNLDVLNAQSQLNAAQRDLAKARYDLLVNGLKLRQLAGVLQPQDIASVNGLLVR